MAEQQSSNAEPESGSAAAPEGAPAGDPTAGAAAPQASEPQPAANESSADAGSSDPAAALAAAEAKAREYYDSYLRTKAEIENFRKRAHEDVVKARKFGIEHFAESLLPVFDSLYAALSDRTGGESHLREGVDLTMKQLKSAFEKNKLVEIDPAGEKFDPHKHQAIAVLPSTGVAPGHVISVLQKGWLIADRVLRPALVTVAQVE